MNTPSYYRERLNAMRHYAERNPEYVTLFRNGHVPEHLREDFEMDLKAHQLSDETPLSFAEITRFNTWFALHPEKVCGIEKVTTSLEFPLTIKGNIMDAVAQMREDMNKAGASGNKNLALAKAKAKALKLKLQLLNDAEKDYLKVSDTVYDSKGSATVLRIFKPNPKGLYRHEKALIDIYRENGQRETNRGISEFTKTKPEELAGISFKTKKHLIIK